MTTQPSQAGFRVSIFIFPRMKFPSVVIAMLCILLPMLRAYLSSALENIQPLSLFYRGFHVLGCVRRFIWYLIHFLTQEASIGCDSIWASITGEMKVPIHSIILEELIFFFKIFFLMWTDFKVFIEFVTILLLFYVLVFWL